MTDTKTQFTQAAAPTDLVWSIIHATDTTKPHKVDEVVQLTQTLYPGINYWHTQLGVIARDIMSPDLAKMFPALKEAKTEEQAVKIAGENVEVHSIKECKGYNWESEKWQQRTAADLKRIAKL